MLVTIDRCGHCNDKDIASLQVFGITGEVEADSLLQLFRLDLQRGVATRCKFRDALRLDIEPRRRVALAEFDREWQTDITEPDHGRSTALKINHRSVSRHGPSGPLQVSVAHFRVSARCIR